MFSWRVCSIARSSPAPASAPGNASPVAPAALTAAANSSVCNGGVKTLKDSGPTLAWICAIRICVDGEGCRSGVTSGERERGRSRLRRRRPVSAGVAKFCCAGESRGAGCDAWGEAAGEKEMSRPPDACSLCCACCARGACPSGLASS